MPGAVRLAGATMRLTDGAATRGARRHFIRRQDSGGFVRAGGPMTLAGQPATPIGAPEMTGAVRAPIHRAGYPVNLADVAFAGTAADGFIQSYGFVGSTLALDHAGATEKSDSSGRIGSGLCRMSLAQRRAAPSTTHGAGRADVVIAGITVARVQGTVLALARPAGLRMRWAHRVRHTSWLSVTGGESMLPAGCVAADGTHCTARDTCGVSLPADLDGGGVLTTGGATQVPFGHPRQQAGGMELG